MMHNRFGILRTSVKSQQKTILANYNIDFALLQRQWITSASLDALFRDDQSEQGKQSFLGSIAESLLAYFSVYERFKSQIGTMSSELSSFSLLWVFKQIVDRCKPTMLDTLFTPLRNPQTRVTYRKSSRKGKVCYSVLVSQARLSLPKSGFRMLPLVQTGLGYCRLEWDAFYGSFYPGQDLETTQKTLF